MERGYKEAGELPERKKKVIKEREIRRKREGNEEYISNYII